MGLGTKPKPRQETDAHVRAKAARNDEFMIQAQALSDALGISFDKATSQLCASQPALYERYRSKLGLGSVRDYKERVAAVHARAEQSEFFTLAKQIAAQQSIDLMDAFSVAARQRPDLYDAYHESL
jgi:hypothetical protein